jgi:hypothetical protein
MRREDASGAALNHGGDQSADAAVIAIATAPQITTRSERRIYCGRASS